MNKALVETIAEAFGVAKSRVRIVSGETSKTKRVEIEGVDEAQVKAVAG